MRAQIFGELVDLDRNEWAMQGKQGVSHTAFVRCGSLREAAQRVRVTERQYNFLSIGELLEWPVDIFPQASDYGGAAKLRVTLDPEFSVSATDARGKSADLADAAS